MNLGPGIIMDIIVAGIFLLSVIWGARKGLALTMASFMQWFVCVIVGFFFCDKVKELLIEHTTLDDHIHTRIIAEISTSIEESSPYQAMPDCFGGWVNDTAGSFAYGTAQSITSVLMTIIAFLLIVVGIKIIGFCVVRLFSARYNDGVVGFFDGFMGFIFGAVRGVILVFLLFAVLVPVLGLIWPSMSEVAVSALEDSYAAGFLYDNNMLLILIRDLFS